MKIALLILIASIGLQANCSYYTKRMNTIGDQHNKIVKEKLMYRYKSSILSVIASCEDVIINCESSKKAYSMAKTRRAKFIKHYIYISK